MSGSSGLASSGISLADAVAGFDREAAQARVQQAEAQRREILSRFPLESWPTLPLERYALGQENSEETYCRWLEFKSPDLGSMKGGNATKLVVYKKRDEPGWFFYKPAANEQQAWTSLRAGFLKMFELAKRGEYDAIDEIEDLAKGPVLRTKSLHVYFADAVLPVYSTAHLLHFLRLVGKPEGEERRYDVIRLNRLLLQALHEMPEVLNWGTVELGFLLYHWADPRQIRRVMKIAPGHEGKFWDECLAGGYICVGWDEAGDLSRYESEQQFREAFRQLYHDEYNGDQGTLRSKSGELWTLAELEAGDLVVANRGTSRILGVGTVVEPGYEWNEARSEFRHTVRVNWDTSYARTILPQKRWASRTVAPVPLQLQKEILRERGSGPVLTPIPVPIPDIFAELSQALNRKGQAVLYGPPGTGKTYTAGQFAAYWLLEGDGQAQAAEVVDNLSKLREAEAALGSRLTRLTFHPSYSYEDFVEGFRPVQHADGGLQLRLEDGVFKRVCRDAEKHPDRRFLVLIDEINRANIAKVFGELITILERDKRGLKLMLPQSKELFAVPENVFVLGTMNTADRSIKLLDVALRRRFAFLELMPDVSLLDGAEIGDLPLDDFLEGLNARIREKEGREKQVGHGYLLADGKPIVDPAEFARRFRQEILPLLQEYCYDDYAALAGLLGAKLVDAEGQRFNRDALLNPDLLLGALAEAYGLLEPQS